LKPQHFKSDWGKKKSRPNFVLLTHSVKLGEE